MGPDTGSTSPNYSSSRATVLETLVKRPFCDFMLLFAVDPQKFKIIIPKFFLARKVFFVFGCS